MPDESTFSPAELKQLEAADAVIQYQYDHHLLPVDDVIDWSEDGTRTEDRFEDEVLVPVFGALAFVQQAQTPTREEVHHVLDDMEALVGDSVFTEDEILDEVALEESLEARLPRNDLVKEMDDEEG